MNEPEPTPPLDTPAALNRQIIATAEYLRRTAADASAGGKTSTAVRATAELSKLLELRLRIAGVLNPPGASPKSGPGRPRAAEEGDPVAALYDVAAQLRAAVLELPAEHRQGAAAVLADAFPAMLAEPREVEKLRPAVPAHLKPPPGSGPPWQRAQWGG